jgi:hypothetical protein
LTQLATSLHVYNLEINLIILGKRLNRSVWYSFPEGYSLPGLSRRNFGFSADDFFTIQFKPTGIICLTFWLKLKARDSKATIIVDFSVDLLQLVVHWLAFSYYRTFHLKWFLVLCYLPKDLATIYTLVKNHQNSGKVSCLIPFSLFILGVLL